MLAYFRLFSPKACLISTKRFLFRITHADVLNLGVLQAPVKLPRHIAIGTFFALVDARVRRGLDEQLVLVQEQLLLGHHGHPVRVAKVLG